MLGAYQQVDARILALFVEQLEEVGFPVAHVDQPRLRYLGSQFHQIAVMLDPDKGLLLPAAFHRSAHPGCAR